MLPNYNNLLEEKFNYVKTCGNITTTREKYLIDQFNSIYQEYKNIPQAQLTKDLLYSIHIQTSAIFCEFQILNEKAKAFREIKDQYFTLYAHKSFLNYDHDLKVTEEIFEQTQKAIEEANRLRKDVSLNSINRINPVLLIPFIGKDNYKRWCNLLKYPSELKMDIFSYLKFLNTDPMLMNETVFPWIDKSVKRFKISKKEYYKILILHELCHDIFGELVDTEIIPQEKNTEELNEAFAVIFSGLGKILKREQEMKGKINEKGSSIDVYENNPVKILNILCCDITVNSFIEYLDK